MTYEIVQSSMKTNKSREFLWNKINTPEKIIEVEDFEDCKVKKMSQNNYELISENKQYILTFIPKTAVNIAFVGNENCPMTWFEIKGENNCTISHGEHKKVFEGDEYDKEVNWLKKHFLEELNSIIE